MKFRYYVLLVLVIMIGIGVSFYLFVPENMSATFPRSSGQRVDLPLSVWMGAVFGLFVLFSMIFFVIDWIRVKIRNFYKRKDFSKLVGQILEEAANGGYSVVSFHDQTFLFLSKVLRRFRLEPKLDSQKSGIQKIDDFFEVFNQVQLGYYQDIKRYDLDPSHPFSVKNLLNQINKDYKTGFVALGNPKILSQDKKEIFSRMLQNCNAKELKKILEATTFLDKEMLFELIGVYKKYQLLPSESEMISLCKRAQIDASGYVQLAKEVKEIFGPDAWVKFFENLAMADEKAELSFFYVLCDLELNSQVMQRLSNLPKDEFLNVRAYIDLKSAGKRYPLDLFFN